MSSPARFFILQEFRVISGVSDRGRERLRLRVSCLVFLSPHKKKQLEAIMAIMKVHGTINHGCFTPLKRARVDVIRHLPRGRGSNVRRQKGECEDLAYIVEHTNKDNEPGAKIDKVRVPRERIDKYTSHTIFSKVAPSSIASNNCQRLESKSLPPPDRQCHNEKVSVASYQFTVPDVESKDRCKVKKTLNAYKEILTKFNKRNCSTYILAAIRLRNEGKWLNMRKQLGAIRGVKVGDKFRYRAQLNIVGLHRHFTNGIDYIKSKNGKMLVTSIVDSGRYANNMQCSDVLIYSGEGGNSPFNKLKPTDQTLERGNLALKNSKEAQTPVRVIRTFKLSKSSCYVYYGLYIVEHLSKGRGEWGKMVYKFRLRRKAGQPEFTFNYNDN
ncbi:hypothetical protein ABKV19_026442 [Rosa sericea]